jgi:hypothetical protein
MSRTALVVKLTVNDTDALKLSSGASNRVDYIPDDFIEVAASRGRISEGQADDLLGVNDEDSANLARVRLRMQYLKASLELTVKGSPLASLFVASCSSSMSYRVQIFLSGSAI